MATRLASWIAVDWAVALYATFVALLAVVCASSVPEWPYILLAHGLLVGALLLLPPRGASWEDVRPDEGAFLGGVRATARFLRYTYPALLLTPFFEEVWFTVNAISPEAPYWFEPYLYEADRAMFGATPAVALSQIGGPMLDEVMHAFYFSYYGLIVGGIFFVWNAGAKGRGTPGPAFHRTMTCMMLGFLLSYVWYPFLPARGPWESPEIVAGLRPFGGWLFTPLIKIIIGGAGVSGGCFPSAHVSGTWALTFALYFSHRKMAFLLSVFATGLTIACVYTRYHHAVDVLAGLTVAAVAAVLGYWLTRTARIPNAM